MRCDEMRYDADMRCLHVAVCALLCCVAPYRAMPYHVFAVSHFRIPSGCSSLSSMTRVFSSTVSTVTNSHCCTNISINSHNSRNGTGRSQHMRLARTHAGHAWKLHKRMLSCCLSCDAMFAYPSFSSLLPKLESHLKKYQIEPSLYATQWFITLFSYNLSFDVSSVTCCLLLWCDVMCRVVSCHVVSCRVVRVVIVSSCHVMSCHVMCCGVSMRCIVIVR